METFAGKIASFFINQKASCEEEREVLVYGIVVGLSFLTNFAATISIGLIFNVLFETMIFFISFSLLRCFAGGYHAKTFWGCAIGSSLLFIIVISLIILTPRDYVAILCLVLVLISLAVVFLLAPVEHPNRPLSVPEYFCFKKRSQMIAVFLAALCGLLYLLDKPPLMVSVALGMAAASFVVLLGKIANPYSKTEERRMGK